MDVAEYVKRIGYRGQLEPTIIVLRRLHRQHMLTVPFENLDIHLGRPIALDTRRFYRKIVLERRGGYCYELNGCFAWLLRRLGFPVSLLSARVARPDGRFTPAFDHLVLAVNLRERWLVDVGFGDNFTRPKPIGRIDTQRDHGYFYRITESRGNLTVSRRTVEHLPWHVQYAFSLQPRSLSEFEDRNRYQQTSPGSHFTQQRLISKLTRTGRSTLTDSKLIITKGDEREERKVNGSDEFDRLLSKHFQIEI
jgi:N-hydroxyarylamine O-acetyltransferase